MAISSQLQMVTALSAILLPPVFQKTTNAVTENNYSFRQSLLLEKQFISPPPTIAAVSTQGTPASEQLCPGLHRRSVLPLPVAETAWPCPLGHKAPKFNFDDTDEEISAISAPLLCDCAVSAGDTGPRLHSVLSQPLAGPRTMRNNLIPQVFLFC